jgi:perosamine synthetase
MKNNSFKKKTLLKNFIVQDDESLLDALKKIQTNSQGIVFVCTNKKLLGVLTDGDIRRFFIKNKKNFSIKVKKVMKKTFIYLNINDSYKKIIDTLNSSIKIIPLVDNNGDVCDYANSFRLHNIPIYEPFFNTSGNEINYVNECMSSGWISSRGKYIELFEKKFSLLINSRYSLSVNNGTSALILALMTLGVRSGDEVIVPNLTFMAPWNAVLQLGAIPVPVEIKKDTMCIDENLIERKISKKTKAIIIVHLYGGSPDISKIKKIVNNNNLFLIEDCAEALGSYYKKKHVGLFGDIGTFSFYGNKTITTGEGGMLVLNKSSLYSKAVLIKNHGMSDSKRYFHEVVGSNFRMTNIQAAIGLAQLERLRLIFKKKNIINRLYYKELKKIKSVDLIEPKNDYKNSYWLFTISLNNKSDISRDDLMKKLLLKGIETRRIFYPANEMPIYKKYFDKKDKYLVSDLFSKNTLSLPSYPIMSLSAVREVINELKKELN